jgi:phosphate transport system substrate-binding protein
MGAMLGFTSSVRAACAIAAIMTCHTPVAASDVLRIGGTGAANGMIKSVGALFTAKTGIAIVLVPSLGTSGANNALANGILDAAISGRPLTPAETAKGLTAVAEMLTPFGLVTSHPHPNGLKSSEIAKLCRSDSPTWADGTPIRMILRPANDSDSWLVGRLFPGMDATIDHLRRRADLSVAATDQDNADMAEKTPGSLVGATLTQIQMEKRNLRFVALDGVTPSLESYANGSYPFGKSFYLVLGAKKNSGAERFLEFLRSPEGIIALRNTGLLLKPE